MAYQKVLFKNKQDLGSEYIVIEFLEKKESPVEEKSQSHIYKLSKPVSKKDLRRDRKMRRKSIIKFERPVSNFSVAERRIFY